MIAAGAAAKFLFCQSVISMIGLIPVLTGRVLNPIQIGAVRRVQRHTGLTHHFKFLTFGHSGAQS